jgi:hypothetical protein
MAKYESFNDIDAVTPVVEMCKDRKKPFSFLLSADVSKMPTLVENAMTSPVGDSLIFATDPYGGG